jgi:PAS domain S-box-containing protein
VGGVVLCPVLTGVESERLDALYKFSVLDSDPEDSFDDLARLAAHACAAPFAFISFINGDRLWFKSTVGFSRGGLPRQFAICDDVIEADGPVVVPDTHADDRYGSSPLVAGEPHARFYAGAPLRTAGGLTVGAIGVMGREPRGLSAAEAGALASLARQTVRLLETRLDAAVLGQIVNHASDIIYRTDERGLFTFVNPVAGRILGYEQGELTGRHFSTLIRPDYKVSVEEFYYRQFRLRENSTYLEFPALSKSGAVVWFGQNVELLTSAAGAPLGFLAVARDITKRKAAEEALTRKDAVLRQALSAARAGTWELDAETGAMTWSVELYRVFGLEPGSREESAESWIALIHPDDREPVRRKSATAVARGEDFELDYRIVRPDGAVRWLSGRGGPLTGDEGARVFTGVAIDITALRRAQEEAREAEEYAKLFRHANDAILVIDPESGVILDVNEKACRTYARPRGELVGAPLSTITRNADEELLILSRQAERGEGLEYEADHHNGLAPVHLLINTAVIDYRSRRAILSINHDITERKAAQDALRRESTLLHALMDNVPDAIYFKDTEGRFTRVNRHVPYRGDKAPEEVVGRTDFDFFDEAHARATYEDEQRIVRTGVPVVDKEEMETYPDGTTTWLSTTKVPVFDAEGKVTGIVGISRDMTGRKRAEELLRAADRRAVEEYEQLLDRLADLALSFGTARDLLTVYRGLRDFCLSLTPSFALIICRYDEDASARHCVYFQLADEENASPDMETIPVRNGPVSRVIRSGEVLISNDYLSELAGREHVGYGFEKDERRPRSALIAPMTVMGRVVGTVEVQSYDLAAYALEHATAVRLAANLAAVAVENVRLLEREREKEQRLLRAQKAEALGSLAGGVAHDFNNIITGVFGFTDLALRHVEALERGGESELTGRLREDLEEVKLSGRRGAELTRQLLAFSRQQQLERRPVDVHHIVKGLLGMLRRVIEENVNIHFHPVAERSTVFADPGQIEQVLVNLAANARDAMPKGGRLLIETANVTLDEAYVERHPYARAGRYVLLSVSDTGAGMSEEVRQRVFEPFFTTKEVDKGTGLGLSTVYGIVKQHGGTVEVYSEPRGGTTFKIYLPLEDGTARESVEAAAAPLEGGTETVLVAENEPSLERLARQVLEGLGYRVVTARDGREAVKVYEARQDEIDLVLLDVIMPRMDGPDAYREMRALAAGAAPVIFMTGYSPELVRGRLEAELGAGAGLLQKPYDADTLGRKVREVLDAVRGGGR